MANKCEINIKTRKSKLFQDLTVLKLYLSERVQQATAAVEN